MEMPPVEDVVAAAIVAGDAILRWYGGDVPTEEKRDRTPLTAADRAAHDSLREGLARVAPSVPFLSEESEEGEVADRHSWGPYWLVDPLDGTKEFLKGTGEFTVNVALVKEGRPILGVVHAPALEKTWVAAEGVARVIEPDRGERTIGVRRVDPDRPVVVASRDHSGPTVGRFVERLGSGVEFASMGSSLKFCLVAEGRADVYLRDGPTMEWDTGAADCIVEAAGGSVVSVAGEDAGRPLRYNKSSLKNPGFLCMGDREFPWIRVWDEALAGGDT